MSLEFQRIKPKRYYYTIHHPLYCFMLMLICLFVNRFAKKSYKHSQESRYWKQFKNVLMERDEGGLQIGEVNFCKGNDKPYLMAAAVSARVDIYSLTQPTGEDCKTLSNSLKLIVEDDRLKPMSTIFKFKDLVTAI